MPNLFIMFLFNYFKHPLSMTIIIICQTLIMVIFMSLTTKTFWMSYILFLVFLGGMLILFLYITSLAPNELFTPHTTLPPIIFSSIIMMFMVTVSFMDQLSWNIMSSNMDMNSIQESNIFISYMNQHLMLIKLYNTPTSMLTLTLVLYLLLTLIAIVKITNIFMGPLRSQTANHK
uniref:NADH-ubiquinone oxidoreductase chain 6 n=1 Tax=Tegra novaehollandiae viridinotata TaxID=1945547 RepID=A0A1Q1MP48_9ORTH|nr:NADH dehydrogenase subunit 6 [Tegra novaehollandiae viridinotata]